MNISGFTIIKNAIINGYPIVEAITSILPVVDEMIVLIGDCDDDTTGLIEGIGDAKIKIHHSTWDKNLRKGGAVLAVETDKAFRLIDTESTWAFYIQADEVIHEKYYEAIRKGCEQYKNDSRVQGLLFKYLHFYGTYDYVGDSRKWYNREVRIIRNDKSIQSYKDAQGFRVGNTKLNVKPIDAFVYHYGWVKSPEQMMKKNKNFLRLWNSDNEVEAIFKQSDYFDFRDFDSLVKFTDSHPVAMGKRIREQNWTTELDISKKNIRLKHLIPYYIEKLTGIRLFEFRNYRVIK
jgi:hypothetical protein